MLRNSLKREDVLKKRRDITSNTNQQMHLTIGPITCSIEGLTEEEIPLNSRQFQTKGQEADICYTFHEVEELPAPDEHWARIFERPDIQVFQHGALEARKLAVGTMQAAYALYQERDERTIDIYYLNTIKSQLLIDTIFVSCLALERHFAKKDAYILHCCFTHHHGQAILFSGPSGIGKSTHAELWCRHIENTHVVNGDRCLIYKDKEGRYWAGAWPVCGSSQICLTEAYPLKAIVFMGQAPHNEVVPVRPMQLFKHLSSQVTINWWNKAQAGQALDSLQHMLGKVNMCNYACNLTPEAPKYLYNYLREKEWIS